MVETYLKKSWKQTYSKKRPTTFNAPHPLMLLADDIATKSAKRARYNTIRNALENKNFVFVDDTAVRLANRSERELFIISLDHRMPPK